MTDARERLNAQERLAVSRVRLRTARARLMLDLYENEGLSMGEIAEKFEVSRQRVHQIIGSQRANVHYGRKRVEDRKKRIFEAHERILAGSTVKAEAERLGMRPNSLSSAFSHFKLTTPGRRSPEHGTSYRYSKGCRCDECSDAMRDEKRQMKERGAPNHGTESGYTNYGCRCPECKRAKRVANREYHKRRKARSYSAD